MRSKGGRPEVNVLSAGRRGRIRTPRPVIELLPRSWAELRGQRSYWQKVGGGEVSAKVDGLSFSLRDFFGRYGFSSRV